MKEYQIPEKARVAVLTGAKKIEVFELPVPEIGDDEVLVKVNVCSTLPPSSAILPKFHFSLSNFSAAFWAYKFAVSSTEHNKIAII